MGFTTTGIDHIQNTYRNHTRLLLERLHAVPCVSVYGPHDARLQTATVSFNIQGMSFPHWPDSFWMNATASCAGLGCIAPRVLT